MLKKTFVLVLGVFLLAACFVWAGGGSQTAAPEVSGGDPDIEVWRVFANGEKDITKNSPMYNLYKEKFGVGVISPYVEWNGGVAYLDKLNMQIAAGTMPNVFLPWNGNEADLAKNGAIADLTDLLPKYAPNLWNLIPQSVWDVVKANDPTGKGRIYWVPEVYRYEKEWGLIRTDWLEKLGLQMPKTQAEYLAVLRAFRDRDPNGNGKADEIPTGGRAGARWMDHLFNMYGVAMYEGYPEWDIYNGELTYSAVTQNAKDALAFIRQLYAEKLIDPETLLNDKPGWESKVFANRVGNYFHYTWASYQFLTNIYQTSGVKATFGVLPVIQVPGYEGKGFVTWKPIGPPSLVVSAKQDEAHLMACMKLLNGLGDQSVWSDIEYGVEGMNHTVVNGKRSIIAPNSSQQVLLFHPFDLWGSLDVRVQLLEESKTPDTEWMFNQSIKQVKELQQYIHAIAGQGLPSTVYTDYPDIQNHSIWQEYASKIIIGTLPVSAFDEYVERWNRSGGAEVTKRAREWYAKTKR
ncbi:MAG: extracellular solute-binding protein [Spirochaetaceae bacterium]|jgi:putative aldouronate transport system substrate-binding protein|nr:extracellular solute-binding protein [Spirochaetaceae bacterium]